MELRDNERLGLGPAVVHADRPGTIDPTAIRKLDLQPEEAFALSRIDGPVSLADLGLMCGMDRATATALVVRLIRLRVLVRLDSTERNAKTVKIPSQERAAKTVKGALSNRAKSKTLRERARTRKMQLLRAQIRPDANGVEPVQSVPSVSVSVQNGREQRPEPSSASNAKPTSRRPRSKTRSERASSQTRTRSNEAEQRARNTQSGPNARGRAAQPAAGSRPGTSRPSATGAGQRQRSTTQPMNLSNNAPRWELVVIDASLLDESLAISVDRQRALLQMSELLAHLTPFELLAIGYTDDTSAIRTAFHQQSRWLHPDAYHGKDLGRYRELLERVFSSVRQAYNDLQSPAMRRRYQAVG